MGSFAVAVADARREWDALTGGPGTRYDDGALIGYYSETAAAGILVLAVALWPDVARRMAPPEDDG